MWENYSSKLQRLYAAVFSFYDKNCSFYAISPLFSLFDRIQQHLERWGGVAERSTESTYRVKAEELTRPRRLGKTLGRLPQGARQGKMSGSERVNARGSRRGLVIFMLEEVRVRLTRGA